MPHAYIRLIWDLNIEDLAGLLSSCLMKFPNLKALEFHEPPLSLPQLHRRVYIDTVTSALRYVRIPNLTELDIHFPITHDFEDFFPTKFSSLQIPISDALQNLRHLGLYVCAFTDRRDRRY